MVDFNPIPNTDAYAAILGFKYQADWTIIRWCELQESEHLELECGEDIDIVASALSKAAEGDSRQLQQIKQLSKAINLRSPECLQHPEWWGRYDQPERKRRRRYQRYARRTRQWCGWTRLAQQHSYGERAHPRWSDRLQSTATSTALGKVAGDRRAPFSLSTWLVVGHSLG